MWDNSIEHCKVSAVHAMKVYGRLDISLHTRWSWVVASHSSRFTPSKELSYPLNRRLFAPASCSGCFGIIHCLFCFFLFIMECVALLEVHLKVSQHVNMVSEKSSGYKQKKMWFNVTWLHFKGMTLWMRWSEDSCCVYCDVWSSVTCSLASKGEVNITVLTQKICSVQDILYIKGWYTFLWINWSHFFFAVSDGWDFCWKCTCWSEIKGVKQDIFKCAWRGCMKCHVNIQKIFRIWRFCVVVNASLSFCSS